MGETMTKTAKITILGCGGSGGVPLATGYWGLCDPNNIRNRRTRASIAIQTDNTTVVIDSGPDFREQTIINNIHNINAIFYTHPHGDHVNGIDDLRYCAIKQRIQGQDDAKISIYADDYTLNDMKNRFAYMFQTSPDGIYIPLLDEHILEPVDSKIINGELTIRNFTQVHGATHSLGYCIGDVTYSTDVSDLDETALNAIKGTRIWILDCGQYGADETTVHANYKKILEWREHIKPEKIYLTHLTPRSDYDTINAETPDDIECAYDGLEIIANI
jgi:phosphoribosyl 1,2-cyclic phosphate phosphodiesterase